MSVIDVHTHMLNRDWLELLRRHGKPRYELRQSLDAAEGIFLDGAPFMTPQPRHFDDDLRIKAMDAAKVDLAVLSLTCANVYWAATRCRWRNAKRCGVPTHGAYSTYRAY